MVCRSWVGSFFESQRVIGKGVGNADAELAGEQIVDQGADYFGAPTASEGWGLIVNKAETKGDKVANVAGGAD